MNSTLQYYRGIVQQLRAEVDSINSLFKHQGIKGNGNETALRDLLTKFIPKRYGIGTGIVIDRHGNQSRQCDIIIYDKQLYPSILSLTSVHFFPVDIVYAVIEVKTTLKSDSAKEARENIASVRLLDFVKDHFAGTEAHNGSLNFMSYMPSPPLGFVFAYNSDTLQFETFKNWFIPDNQNISLSPTMIGCLDQGLLVFQDSTNHNIWTHPDAEAQLKGWMFFVEDNSGTPGTPIKLDQPQETFESNCSVYPVKKQGEMYIPIDQGRVLLFFLTFLHEIISRKQINPAISFINEYLADLRYWYEV